ncbi:membrane protein [Bacteroidia bacterium]|nr:membrane protein [Bacteroidia bacterium]
MKWVLSIVFVCLYTKALYAQHDSQIGSYAFNQVMFNPAYAGGAKRSEATILQRSQFIGFAGAPSVWNIAIKTPFEIEGLEQGAAFTLSSDRIGAFNKLHFAMGYAYWHKLQDAKIGAGVSLGAVSYTMTPTWEGIVDEAIPTQKESASAAFDVNVGLCYQRQNWSVGLSCTHVNQPQTLKLLSEDYGLTVQRTFYLNGEYRWQTPIEDLWFNPTAMVMMVSLLRPQLGIGGYAVYREQYWGGLSYRIGDAVGIMAGLFIKSLKFGLVYEYSLSKFAGYNGGNTEIFASYMFDINWSRKKKHYKSLRFLK